LKKLIESGKMNLLSMIKGLVWAFLLKTFPSLGYKGTVDTQISAYNRLKRKFPAECENDLLNTLIMSRIEAPPRVASKQEEYTHYEPLLENPDKTLEDVIWAIVEYEYILSREEHLFNQLSKMYSSSAEILADVNILNSKVRRYIKESIKEKCGVANMQFTKLKSDYKAFVLVLLLWVVFLLLGIHFTSNSSNSIFLVVGAIAIVLCWFYAIKVVIDTFRVFKSIKATGLQIGISVFLFCICSSPLIMGLYVLRLINRYKKADRFDLASNR